MYTVNIPTIKIQFFTVTQIHCTFGIQSLPKWEIEFTVQWFSCTYFIYCPKYSFSLGIKIHKYIFAVYQVRALVAKVQYMLSLQNRLMEELLTLNPMQSSLDDNELNICSGRQNEFAVSWVCCASHRCWTVIPMLKGCVRCTEARVHALRAF